MNKTTSVAPVRKSVTVNCRPSHAFEVFTAPMSQWWNPPTRSDEVTDQGGRSRAPSRWALV
jgi:hypothetical protein